MNTHAYFNSRTFEGIVSNLYSGDVENNLWGTNRKLEGNLKSKSSKIWFKIILHRLEFELAVQIGSIVVFEVMFNVIK